MRILLTAIAVLSATACVSKMASCQTGIQPYSAMFIGNQVNGANLWNYTLINTSESNVYTVILVQLEVDEQTQVVRAPNVAGWYVDPTIPNFVTWASKYDGLTAGQSVTDFAVEFSKKPEFQNWTALFNNIDDPGEYPSDNGVVLNASAVPEPGGLASFAVGLISFFGILKRRRA